MRKVLLYFIVNMSLWSQSLFQVLLNGPFRVKQIHESELLIVVNVFACLKMSSLDFGCSSTLYSGSKKQDGVGKKKLWQLL